MVGVLCRISGDKEEGKDRSIHEQGLLGKALAKKLKLPFEIYKEEHISGTFPLEKRPELERLLDDIEDGKVTVMYIWFQDRLERNPQVRFIVKETLKKYNCKLYTEAGEIDLHDDALDMHGDMMSIFNAYFVRTTKKRVKKILKTNAEEGRIHGTMQYGYKASKDNHYIHDEDEKIIIERIFNYSLDGVSTHKIAVILNEENVPTRRSKKWLASTVYNILKSPTYKGQKPTKNLDSGFMKVMPIIDSIKWDDAQSNLTSNRIYSGIPITHPYLLKGVLKCSKCGGEYRGVVSMKNNYYDCNSKRRDKHSCNNRGVNITRIDNLIWSRFFKDKRLIKLIKKHLSNFDGEIKTKKLKVELTELDAEIKTNEIEADNIRNLAIKGFYTDIQLKPEITKNTRSRNRINRKIKSINEQIYHLNKDNIDYDGMLNNLDNLKNDIPTKDRSDIIKKNIKSINIGFYLNHYNLELNFNLPEMHPEHLIINKRFYYIIEPFKSEISIQNNVKIKRGDKVIQLSDEDFFKSKYNEEDALNVFEITNDILATYDI